jgi:hypothetical protein
MNWLKSLLAMAARPKPSNPSDVLSLTVLLVVGLPLLAVAIGVPLYYLYHVLKRDEEPDEEEPDANKALLAQIEAARAEGEIGDEEYERVRALLARRLTPDTGPLPSQPGAGDQSIPAPGTIPPTPQDGGSVLPGEPGREA